MVKFYFLKIYNRVNESINFRKWNCWDHFRVLLAKQGHDVTVIERQNSVALETSHGNAGQLSYSFSSPWAAPGLPLSLIKWMFSKYPPLIVNPNLNSETVKFLYQMLKNCNSKSYEMNKSRMVRMSNFSARTSRRLAGASPTPAPLPTNDQYFRPNVVYFCSNVQLFRSNSTVF